MNQVATQHVEGFNAIDHALKSKETTSRLCLALGLNYEDENEKNRPINTPHLFLWRLSAILVMTKKTCQIASHRALLGL